MRSYPIKASVVFITTLYLSCSAIAQTTFTNGGGDQLWFNPLNWNNGLPTAGNDATIPPGFNAVINLSANYVINFNVTNQGNLTVNPSLFNITSQNDVDNYNALAINSLWINEGNFLNLNTGSITNFSTFRNMALASLVNQGSLTNGGSLQNGANALLTNQGYIQITGGNTMTNAGTVNNLGSIDNFGKITHLGGLFNNTSLLTNFDELENHGQFQNAATGNLNSGGTLHNLPSGNIDNNGVLASTFLLDNEGNIQNDASMITSNTFSNSGTFVNNDTYTNNGGDLNNLSGHIDNYGDFANTGDISHQIGTFNNRNCAQYFNQPGASTTYTAPGAFTNNGIAYQLGGSVFQITVNNGALLTSLAQDPQPDAQCTGPVVAVLNAANTATITPAQVDFGSEAPYCPGVSLSLSQTVFNCGHIGNNIVTLTVTDTYGNTATCTATIFVTETIDPVITCPDNITVQAVPYACDASVTFAPVATDNCGVVSISHTDGTGLVSGDAFPFGTTWLTMEAADQAGNTADCAFSITVLEYVPASQSLSCDNLVHVSLEEDCSSLIRPQTILEGNYGCADDFIVDINQSGNNIVTSDHIGQTLPVNVTNTETGMSCWGYILVEDKLPPSFSCQNASVPCSATDLAFPPPVIADCSDYTIAVSDQVIELPCDLPLAAIRYRTYSVTDAYGNVATCTQTISYESADISEVDFPADISIDCGVNWTADANGHPAPSPTQQPSLGQPGSPTLEGYPIYPDNVFCQFDAAYTDQVVPICDGTYKIARTWVLVEWCGNDQNDIIQYTQIIKIMDTTPPDITCPVDRTISTTESSCFGNIVLQAPLVSDNCSSVTGISVSASQGNLGAGNTSLSGLPLGYTTVTHTATDGCDNTATCTYLIWVEDLVTPVAVCDEITQIAVDNNGEATAYATTFDDGSNDNCGIHSFQVRRLESNCDPNGTIFADSVHFDCCDVGDTIGVVLRVWDVNGNYNDCMVQVYVEDKIEPTISCPGNVVIYCDEGYNLWDLEVFGQPEFTDNCSVDTTYIREWDLGQCAEGFIYRTWIFSDPGGNVLECSQKITIMHHSDFIVDFPEDITFDDCQTGQVPLPAISDDECELVAISYEDLVFDIVPDACYKIVRTWTVINWCVYDANNPDNDPDGLVLDDADHIFQDNGDGYIQYQQIIKIIDTAAPVITSNCEDITIDDTSFEDDVPGDGDPTTSCDGLVTLGIEATDLCTEYAELEFRYWVYINGDTSSTPITGYGPALESEFPYGTHFIKWEVEDGCGNITFCEYHFTVRDKKKPSVVCHFGLSANLLDMDTDGNGTNDAQMVIIWDSEVLQSWDDNCTPNSGLISRITRNTGSNTPPAETSVVFDCDDLGQQEVVLWVGDGAGNWDFCNTFIEIQDNFGICGPVQAMATLSGEMRTEENETVGAVQVEVQQMPTGILWDYITEADGLFEVDVPTTHDYLVTASRTGDFGNGVSTYDIVLITKHILGVQPLGSPYKMIAADVNNNAAITAMDLVEIRKLILGITGQFPGNDSWRFIDRDYVFPNPSNPWEQDLPESIYFENMVAPGEGDADFIATKIGDVNSSAIANAEQAAQDRHSSGTLMFLTENMEVRAGATFEMPFRTEMRDIEGYQFTLSFDPANVELTDIICHDAALSADHFGVFDDAITTSWNGVIHQSELFTLVFTARKDITTSEVFRIGSSRTIAEGYRLDGSLLDIGLYFDNGSVSLASDFELYQNEPNPFSRTTTIRFSLPEAGQTRLRIVDAAGREIWKTEQRFTKGYHAVDIDGDWFPSEGMYFYILENDQYTATKKMIFNR